MSVVLEQELAGRRIAVVNWRDLEHRLAGGAEIYAWQFAVALRDAGAQVTFVTARERGSARVDERDGIAVRRGGGALGFYLFAAWWLLTHRRRLDAVIDPACGIPTYSPLFVRRRTGVLLVVHHVHQEQFGMYFPEPVAAFGRWLERVAMRHVYARRTTVAVSHSTRLEMRSRLGWSTPVDVLENGSQVSPLAAVEAVAKDPDRIVVLGRLVPHKRVDLALVAVHDALQSGRLAGREVRVDVVGRGPERQRLEQLADELGIADRVVIHGYVSEERKREILARASVHICASDAEGWGQSIIDAASWGVPTIARDVPGLRDSVRPGETGWLVADNTDLDVVRRRLAEALVPALVAAAQADTSAHRVVACHAWAQKFDWSSMRANARARTAQLITGTATAEPAPPTRVMCAATPQR